jgi:3'-phosphoadenosine 5'-phosphosulfate sulfotransferase (PAPS reductase)/FAD synthetase
MYLQLELLEDNQAAIEAARLPTPEQVIAQGGLVVSNHSGGKDSSIQLDFLARTVPHKQLAVCHASLGRFEWPGAEQMARHDAARYGLPFILAKSNTKDFLQMVERKFLSRPDVSSWPSPANRQCTSDLKRGPIEREVRAFAEGYGYSSIITAMGIRAAESDRRSKAYPWTRNAKQCNGRRQWYNWMPVHSYSHERVWAARGTSGVDLERRRYLWRQGEYEAALRGWPFHWAYVAGNERLSCIFCIMGSPSDLRNGAYHFPDLYGEYIDMEAKTGYTMLMSREPLEEAAAVPFLETLAQRSHIPTMDYLKQS